MSVTPLDAAATTTRTRLFVILLVGLFVLGSISLVSAVVLIVNGHDGTPGFAIASAIVAGTLALFTRPPGD